MAVREPYETVERAVAERRGKLGAGDMERIGPYLRKGEDGSALIVDYAFWVDERGDIFRAFIRPDWQPDGPWRVCGTQSLDWFSWGRTHMIREECRYKGSMSK